MYKHNPVICAIDTRDMDYALHLSSLLEGKVAAIKLGLEFFTSFGIDGVKRVTKNGKIPLFLDLKFHDIPNTIAGAVKSSMVCKPFLLTVHASGGSEMMKIAVETAKEEADKLSIRCPQIITVTLLTSLGKEYLPSIGVYDSIPDYVLRLAELSSLSGANGFVCSGQEVEILNDKFGKEYTYVVPGVRSFLDNDHDHDQKRIVTPRQAMNIGASYIVIGREITKSVNPELALDNILKEINNN